MVRNFDLCYGLIPFPLEVSHGAQASRQVCADLRHDPRLRPAARGDRLRSRLRGLGRPRRDEPAARALRGQRVPRRSHAEVLPAAGRDRRSPEGEVMHQEDQCVPPGTNTLGSFHNSIRGSSRHKKHQCTKLVFFVCCKYILRLGWLGVSIVIDRYPQLAHHHRSGTSRLQRYIPPTTDQNANAWNQLARLYTSTRSGTIVALGRAMTNHSRITAMVIANGSSRRM